MNDGFLIFPEGRKAVIASLRQRIRAATAPSAVLADPAQRHHAVCERCRARAILHVYRSHSTHGVVLCATCAAERGYTRWFADQKEQA